MPDSTDSIMPPPPKGDEQKAVKYINQLVELIRTDKLEVVHTDLMKFDPSSLQDHYRMDVKDYLIEISHSKQPNSGADSYVLLFTNVRNIRAGGQDKVILAYVPLSREQFLNFKTAADGFMERRRKAEEDKRFKDAMSPVDQALDEITFGEEDTNTPEEPKIEMENPFNQDSDLENTNPHQSF